MTTAVPFLRFLLWLLAAALILNAILATLAYGSGGIRGIAGFVIMAGLVLTNPSIRKRLR